MKTIRLFILILLLTWVSASFNIGVAVVGPLTKTAFSCIASTQHLYESGPFAIIRIYKVFGTPGVDPNPVQTLINANTAALRYKIHAYMELCRNTDPIGQVDAMFAGVSTKLYSTLWVKVEPNNTPGCSWSGHNIIDNCIFLTEVINAIRSTLITFGSIGVFSIARIWQEFFGTSCTSIPKIGAFLWYSIYNKSGQLQNVASFGDFIPFGGWTLGYMKQVQGNQTISLIMQSSKLARICGCCLNSMIFIRQKYLINIKLKNICKNYMLRFNNYQQYCIKLNKNKKLKYTNNHLRRYINIG